MVGVQAEPGDVRGDPQRLERPHARRRGPPPHQVPGHLGQPVPGHDQVNGAERARVHARLNAVEPGRDVAGGGTEHGEHRVVLADVGHLDPQHEPHGLEELHQRRGGARLHVHPHRGAVIGQGQVVFDVPVRAEDERLRGRSGGQPVQLLRGQAVQPAQPVRPGDPDDAAVGPVHDARRLLGRALLAHRVAVVRGHALVRPAGLHRSRPGQQLRLFPAGSGIGGRPAVGAAAEDGEVADVGLEAVAFLQGGDQRADGVRPDLGDPAAVAADQVHVVGVGWPGGRWAPRARGGCG